MLINEGCVSCAFCVRVRRHDVGDRVGFISSDERKSIKSNNLDFLKYKDDGGKDYTESISCYRKVWVSTTEIDGFKSNARFRSFCNKYIRYCEDFERRGIIFSELEEETKNIGIRNLNYLTIWTSIFIFSISYLVQVFIRYF